MSNPDQFFQLEKARVRASFGRAAGRYDGAAVLQREVGARLIERFKYLKIKPSRVLDLGAGTGAVTEQLLKAVPKAQVVALDFAEPMLQLAKTRGGWFRKPKPVCADALALPFADASFDLVFSNMAVQWFHPLHEYLQEVRRVMKPGGVFLFSSCGPDTLKELRSAWQTVDDKVHTHGFLDMHDVGDAMLRSGFHEPVMYREMMTLTYQNVRTLMRDLGDVGASNASGSQQRGLTGKGALRALESAYEPFRQKDGLLPLSYEMLYGIGWLGESSLPAGAIPIQPVT